MSSAPYLFVYGTLLRSQSKNLFSRYLAQNADLLGRAAVFGRLCGLKRYPGMRPPLEQGDLVTGEVFRLRRPVLTLQTLDAYEARAYRRVRLRASLEDARMLRCWVYIYRHPLPRHRRIDSGMWENRNS